jgi:hypothetical protein
MIFLLTQQRFGRARSRVRGNDAVPGAGSDPHGRASRATGIELAAMARQRLNCG